MGPSGRSTTAIRGARELRSPHRSRWRSAWVRPPPGTSLPDGPGSPGSSSPRAQGEDLVIETSKPRRSLGHQLRLEARLPIPRYFNFDRAEISLQPLAARPVTPVALRFALRAMPLVAQMRRQLRLQYPFYDGLRKLLQKPVLPGYVFRRRVVRQ